MIIVGEGFLGVRHGVRLVASVPPDGKVSHVRAMKVSSSHGNHERQDDEFPD